MTDPETPDAAADRIEEGPAAGQGIPALRVDLDQIESDIRAARRGAVDAGARPDDRPGGNQ